MAFAWTAKDHDWSTTEPEAVRYLLKKFGTASEPCLLQYEYEDGAFPIRNDDPAWSPWIRYDAPMDSGHAHHHDPASGFRMHVFGMWLGFVISAGFVAVIIVGMAHSLRQRDRRLAEAREVVRGALELGRIRSENSELKERIEHLAGHADSG